MIALALLLLSVFTSITLCYWLYFHKHSISREKIAEKIEALQLPESIAERRRLMEIEIDEAMLKKLKEAARLSTQRPDYFFIERWFRQADLYDDEDRNGYRTGGVLSLIAGLVIVGLFGSTFGRNGAFAGAALGALLGTLFPLIFLRRRANEREYQLSLSLYSILRPLKLTLDRGFDLSSAIKELVRGSGVNEQNEILPLLQFAVDCTEDGTSIKDSLRSVCEQVEHKRFTQLCSMLLLTEEHGAGWLIQLENLENGIAEDLAVKRMYERSKEPISNFKI